MAAKQGAERRAPRPRKSARQDVMDREAFRLGWRLMSMLQRYDVFVGSLEEACENSAYAEPSPDREGHIPFKHYSPSGLASEELELADGRRELAEALAELRTAAATLNARCESLQNDPKLQRALDHEGPFQDGDVTAADVRAWLTAGSDAALRSVADRVYELVALMEESARAHFQFGLVLSRLELSAPVLERAFTFELAFGQTLLAVFPELRRLADPLERSAPVASAEYYERADRDRCEEAVMAAASRLRRVHREMPSVGQLLDAVRGVDELGCQRWDSVALRDAEQLLWPTPQEDPLGKVLDSERELGVECVEGENCLVYGLVGLPLNRNMQVVAELLVRAQGGLVTRNEAQTALGNVDRGTMDSALNKLRRGIKKVFEGRLELKNEWARGWRLVKLG